LRHTLPLALPDHNTLPRKKRTATAILTTGQSLIGFIAVFAPVNSPTIAGMDKDVRQHRGSP
jgi:hypothetical protein